MKYPENISSVEVRNDVAEDEISNFVSGRTTPVLIKGAVSHWSIVTAAHENRLSEYLSQFDNGRPLVVFHADSREKGRIFYNESMDGFNFKRNRGKLLETLRALECRKSTNECCYVGSTPIEHHLPGLRADNNDLVFTHERPLASLWFGNRTRVAAHFDLPDNLACVVAGRRRFTLFPPEQVANLYPGPLDFNPAGQSISMVDFYAPDFDRFPRYQDALDAALVAEMEAGDVLFVPSMWWHQVEGLEDLNMLVNYWWRATPTWSGLPQDALMHALLSIGGLPKAQRVAWKNLFEYFVVNREEAAGHLPPKRHGLLQDINKDSSDQLKKLLIEKLQRTQ